ncbi:hypothetical protein CK203_048246 [Vitis vinifera]|uniref:Glycosyl hydrolase family 32 N-terminal domain-containing protein n=1 Tax=Vitis vinifera TaxID=29760 RepID=A0A438H176_VITVI|nr:hypothetical protein CK203_048246 [Vitis vinifera]
MEAASSVTRSFVATSNPPRVSITSPIASNPAWCSTPATSAPASNESLSSAAAAASSSSRGLVFDLGPSNSWDSAQIGSPVVKRFLSDDEERWYMWYHGASNENSASDSIGLAVSSNGVHWERGGGPVRSGGDVGLVMNCGKDWWAFDTMSIRPSDVVIMSSNRKTQKGLALRMGRMVELARFSSLCRGWPSAKMGGTGARIEGEITPELCLMWDWKTSGIPCTLPHRRLFSMETVISGCYYHSFDVENGQFAIGIARGGEGLCGEKPEGWKYVMAYEGVDGNGRRSIGLAVSPDGLKEWRRSQDEAVLMPAEDDGWDNKGVGSPCLVQMDGDGDGGEWRLYYRGIGQGGRTGIGMAVCEGSDRRRFRKWTGFHL